jgi:hypothetical protein
MSERRTWRVIDQAIDAMAVDLGGLVVYTEAASGPYLWTPLLAARAGAEHVYALAGDTHHHRAADVEAQTMAAAARAGLAERIEVVRAKRPEQLAQADVVTNSATLRPITAADVAALKPTAALPLMWETWEFTGDELDLDACRRHGIVVLGTHECRPPCNLVPYMGFLAVRVLFELGLEGHGTSVILLGRQALGAEMERFLRAAGLEVETFSAPGDGGRPYSELAAHVAEHGARHDALIVADAADRTLLVGPGGALDPAQIAAVNPELRIGVVVGEIDARAARDAGLVVFPERARPRGRADELRRVRARAAARAGALRRRAAGRRRDRPRAARRAGRARRRRRGAARRRRDGLHRGPGLGPTVIVHSYSG